MQDRFKFRATVKGYYYIDTPDKCEEFEPLIFLENIDVLDIGDIGIPEEDLEIAIRKQYSDLQDIYIERMMENFRDNSNGIDTYITITPEQIYQCTGLKDKNGELIYELDYVRYSNNTYKVEIDKFLGISLTNISNGNAIIMDDIVLFNCEVIGNEFESNTKI